MSFSEPLSISQLSENLKNLVEKSFDHVLVKGEISGLKRHTSGHVYFALKDHDAVLDAVCWRGVASSFQQLMADGLEVIARGRITTYPARSKYQMVVENVQASGQGALLKLLEERKAKLAAEGLFDLLRKKPLPFMPQIIGIITSPTGAVIKDILHRLQDRFPCRVLLWPVLVQGTGSAEQIATAISKWNEIQDASLRPDVLIVARGGGSLEDLWAFNEEVVVRATANSAIPIISAVGHETDTTLIDYASDKRAPTPTAAAEMATPVMVDIWQRLQECQLRLNQIIQRFLEHLFLKVFAFQKGLLNPRSLLEQKLQRLDDWTERLVISIEARLTQCAQFLYQHVLRPPHALIEAEETRLNTLRDRFNTVTALTLSQYDQHLSFLSMRLAQASYHKALEKGFCMLSTLEGAPLTSVHHVPNHKNVTLAFHDGNVLIRKVPPNPIQGALFE